MTRTNLAAMWAIGSLVLAASACAEQALTKPIIADPVYTKPYRLVDVGGGRRINLYCRGTGSPTVIFSASPIDIATRWSAWSSSTARMKINQRD